MCRGGKYKNGNPKRASSFICLKCLDWKFTYIQGIQRGGHQREKGHTKNLYCIYCNEITRNTEVRWRDSYDEMMDRAIEVHREYYSEYEMAV